MHDLSPVLLFLLQLGLIIGISRLMGLVFARFNQPTVIGEMVAGIMLGPSLLGAAAPGLSGALFPPESVGLLGMVAQLGVVLFLFLIGLELDPKLLRKQGEAAVVISHASIVAPFLLGAALMLYLYPRLYHDEPQMSFTPVALFMGAAMSITAFPVLARILTERNLQKTRVGAIAITCAAVDDVTAWCLLAFVVAVARAEGMADAVQTAVLAGVYVALMFYGVRPFLRRLEHAFGQRGRLNANILALIVVLIFASAIATEWIGIHALFGAFLMGTVMPKGADFVRELTGKLEDFTVVVLLPVFFAFTGLRTQIGLLDSAELWFDAALIIAVATLGKFGGSALAARAVGLGGRESTAIGVLMNTRGLMELVILNIGLELGVITPAVFAMMVVMALVTTAMTSPLLSRIYPGRLYAEEPGAVPAPAAGRRYRVLVPVADPRSGRSLVRMADLLSRGYGEARQILALHLRQPVQQDAFRGVDGFDPPPPLPPDEDPLAPLTDYAAEHQLPVVPIVLTAGDIAAAVDDVAKSQRADLILIGVHRPVWGRALLGGTVHRVLTGTSAHVCVFVDRGLIDLRRVLVPYLGSPHDRLSMELAGRIARAANAELTVLHVIPPERHAADPRLHARTEVDRVMKDHSQPRQVHFLVVSSASPIAAVLEAAGGHDLTVIGVGEEFGLESHLFGLRPERIAEECPTSLLVCRRHLSVSESHQTALSPNA